MAKNQFDTGQKQDNTYGGLMSKSKKKGLDPRQRAR